jgi:hypothetical protein
MTKIQKKKTAHVQHIQYFTDKNNTSRGNVDDGGGGVEGRVGPGLLAACDHGSRRLRRHPCALRLHR